MAIAPHDPEYIGLHSSLAFPPLLSSPLDNFGLRGCGGSPSPPFAHAFALNRSLTSTPFNHFFSFTSTPKVKVTLEEEATNFCAGMIIESRDVLCQHRARYMIQAAIMHIFSLLVGAPDWFHHDGWVQANHPLRV